VGLQSAVSTGVAIAHVKCAERVITGEIPAGHSNTRTSSTVEVIAVTLFRRRVHSAVSAEIARARVIFALRIEALQRATIEPCQIGTCDTSEIPRVAFLTIVHSPVTTGETFTCVEHASGVVALQGSTIKPGQIGTALSIDVIGIAVFRGIYNPVLTGVTSRSVKQAAPHATEVTTIKPQYRASFSIEVARIALLPIVHRAIPTTPASSGVIPRTVSLTPKRSTGEPCIRDALAIHRIERITITNLAEFRIDSVIATAHALRDVVRTIVTYQWSADVAQPSTVDIWNDCPVAILSIIQCPVSTVGTARPIDRAVGIARGLPRSISLIHATLCEHRIVALFARLDRAVSTTVAVGLIKLACVQITRQFAIRITKVSTGFPVEIRAFAIFVTLNLAVTASCTQ